MTRNKWRRRPAFGIAWQPLWLMVLVSVWILSSLAMGQLAAAQRPLTHNDYDHWRSIQGPKLSRDGKFLAYVLAPQEGDGELVVRQLVTGAEWRYPRGYRVPETDDAQDPALAPPPGPITAPAPGRGQRLSEASPERSPHFTADGRAVLFQIAPTKAEGDKAKKARKKPDEMPKNALGIMDTATGKVTRIARVKSFQVPEEGAGYVAYLLEPKPEEKKEEKKETASEEKKPTDQRGVANRRGGGTRATKSKYGSDLVLRSLTDGSERVFADVLEFTFSKDARSLVYAVSSKKEETNGVYAVTPGRPGPPVTLLSGRGQYAKLAWDEKQTQLAFLSDRDHASAKPPKFKLYHWDRQAAAAKELIAAETRLVPPGWVISDRAALTFSEDGRRLFFGTALPREPEKDENKDKDKDKEPASENSASDDKVVADLWHWQDDYIQPMQKVRAEQEKDRSYRAVFHLQEKIVTQLADGTMAEATPSQDGLWALGFDDRPYRVMVGYDSRYSDAFLVNTTDGSRRQLRQKQRENFSWSPKGHFALFFEEKSWHTLSIPDGKITNLTKNLGVNFWREDFDAPDTPPSYGNGGWTADEKYVLLYDRYDIWRVAPDGRDARCLTDGAGRKEKIQFRYVRLDPQEKAIDSSRPLLLRAENEWTRDTGFYRVGMDGGSPARLIMAAKSFSNPTKAKDADVLLLTGSTFNEFPDLLVTHSDFKDLKKVSDANPQKAQLLWGAAELIRFKSADGAPLSGVLIKPENFDPNKKYPMLVYIYEKLSSGLHRFINPQPSTSINATYYVSNGYLVLMPDIAYTVGYPGQSALKCVLPAIQAVVDRGFVNEHAIGIQGHSWGGYQIAYMVTQTNRFKAAAAGAAVANMTSAYSGIRWGTGLPRQFQYEHTQSRIGGTLWQYPMRFIENSPVFMADRVQTPLLLLHNDADDAVPWYQGIEYFLALRRLGKEVYMFNYNGERHGLRKRPNQRDYTMRLQQFFDHHLKGEPKPEWMAKGIPYLEREKEKEKYKAEPITEENKDLDF